MASYQNRIFLKNLAFSSFESHQIASPLPHTLVSSTGWSAYSLLNNSWGKTTTLNNLHFDIKITTPKSHKALWS